jgi:hypothetical protein
MRHPRTIAFAAVLAAVVAMPALSKTLGSPDAFDFVAIGDMPYKPPEDNVRFERLIAAINALQPEFTIHVGDIKSGSSPCSDEMFAKTKRDFDSFAQPVIYTPGDNEWTDCHRKKAGEFDPLERLAKLRATFYPDAKSQGAQKIDLERQADLMPDDKLYVENARWAHGNVLFVTVHVIGSNNNLQRNEAAADEYFARNAANVAWIKDSYAAAARDGRTGIVFAMQANPQFQDRGRDGNGFNDTLDALEAGAVAYGKPVLLIQGDSHRLIIDQPFHIGDGEEAPALENFTRLQVMGELHVAGVRVMVDPSTPGLFAFQPLWVLENRVKPEPTN